MRLKLVDALRNNASSASVGYVRSPRLFTSFLLCFCWLIAVAVDEVRAEITETVHIRGGAFTPLLKTKQYGDKVTVKPFFIDRHAVTRAQFRDFISSHSDWGKSRPAGLFSDTTYLSNWSSATTAPQPETAPVTFVSWFAAKAYCAAQGKRLPTAAEWEFVGLASETKPDGRRDPEYTAKILKWYEHNTQELPPVGQSKNFYGVQDMHGLIWEWVDDFNGEFTSGDSRGDGSAESSEFCGAAALKVNEQTRRDYAAFMRYAFRGSVRGNYAIWNLGFRCARSNK